jgi:hypothetical protein
MLAYHASNLKRQAFVEPLNDVACTHSIREITKEKHISKSCICTGFISVVLKCCYFHLFTYYCVSPLVLAIWMTLSVNWQCPQVSLKVLAMANYQVPIRNKSLCYSKLIYPKSINTNSDHSYNYPHPLIVHYPN